MAARRRALLAGVIGCLLLSGCGPSAAPRPQLPPEDPAAPSVTFTAMATPVDCVGTLEAQLGGTGTCMFGGSGQAGSLGKLRLFGQVQIGRLQSSGCASAKTAGSISGAGWSAPFSADGEWCGQEGTFAYKLQGGGSGRLAYRAGQEGVASVKVSGELPVPQVRPGGYYADRPAPTTGCGKRPPVAPGLTGELNVGADPALALGASTRTYRVHVPSGYRPERPTPVMLFFHGNGATAAATESQSGFSPLADERGFIAVYPQGVTGSEGAAFWASSGRVDGGVDDLRYTADLISDLQARLCVDARRVHAGGFSAGGGIVNWLACELAGRIAAFAAVSGMFYTEPGGCSPSRPVPILEIHGTADEAVPYAGRTASADWPLPLPSIPAWSEAWAGRAGCAAQPAIFVNTDSVVGSRWSGCRGDGEVVTYRVKGGGHPAPRTLAGRPITDVIWDFLAAHRLPG